MPETATEKALCEQCGVETRENTQFCYNCGTHINGDVDETPADTVPETNGDPPDVSSETRSALDDLTAKLDAQLTEEPDKLAQAAQQRRRARVIRHQPKEYVWEPVEESSGGLILLVSLLIALLAVVIVYLTVYWK